MRKPKRPLTESGEINVPPAIRAHVQPTKTEIPRDGGDLLVVVWICIVILAAAGMGAYALAVVMGTTWR